MVESYVQVGCEEYSCHVMLASCLFEVLKLQTGFIKIKIPYDKAPCDSVMVYHICTLNNGLLLQPRL